jgi:hypothetical protein
MAKKSSGTNYVSKGDRPNLARKTRNMLRRDRRENPAVEDVMRSYAVKQEIIAKPRGDKQRELRERYIAEEDTHYQALKLFEQYKEAGIKWAACIQAIKTNFVEHLHNKWSPRLKAVKGTAE